MPEGEFFFYVRNRGRTCNLLSAARIAAATFHIVIADGTGSFFHTGLQLTEAVADTHAERAVGITAFTGRIEVFAKSRIVESPILGEEIRTVYADCQTVFQERTIHVQTVVRIAASFALQRNVRRASATIQTLSLIHI